MRVRSGCGAGHALYEEITMCAFHTTTLWKMMLMYLWKISLVFSYDMRVGLKKSAEEA